MVNRSLLWLLVMAACDLTASWVAVWCRFGGAREALTTGEDIVEHRCGGHVVVVPTCDFASVDCVFGVAPENVTGWCGPREVGLRLTGDDGRPLLVAPVLAPAEALLFMVRTLRGAAPHIGVRRSVLKLMAAELEQS